jgi:hypothetical protein
MRHAERLREEKLRKEAQDAATLAAQERERQAKLANLHKVTTLSHRLPPPAAHPSESCNVMTNQPNRTLAVKTVPPPISTCNW